MDFGSEMLIIGEGTDQFQLTDGRMVRDGKEFTVDELRKAAFAKDLECPVCGKTESACSCVTKE